MSDPSSGPYRKYDPYIPATLSEIHDQLASMMLGAPTFLDDSGYFPERNLDSEFYVLVESFGVVRKKIGEERYVQLIDLARRAKALFADDPDDANGKTDEGRELLLQMEDVTQAMRKHRADAKLKDDEGEITGD